VTYLRIKELAEEQRLNITTLSRRAEIAYSTAHALWHDRTDQLNRKTLDRVALALGVNVGDLFGGTPQQESSESDPPASPSRL
jgi:DNA-binding Xre family transcriptional regulator